MPKKLEECVDKVKGKKGVKSAWAICTSSMQKAKKRKKLKERMT